MDEFKFTKGPWEVINTDDDSCMGMTIITPKGLFNTDSMGMLSNEDDEKIGKVIAITFHQLHPIVGYEACENNEDDGNAQLIASAPEMYQALEDIVEQLLLIPLSPEVLSAISIYEKVMFNVQGGLINGE